MTRRHALTLWVADLPHAALQCWANRHAWDDYTVRDEPGSVLIVTVLCPRCTTLRHERSRLARGRAVLLSRWYDYPEGYSASAAGLGHITRADREVIRYEALQRMRRRLAGGQGSTSARGSSPGVNREEIGV